MAPVTKKEEEGPRNPDNPVTRTIGNGEQRPQIGKAKEFLPATYPTSRGNIREDR